MVAAAKPSSLDPHRREDSPLAPHPAAGAGPEPPEPVDVAGTLVHPVTRDEAADLVAAWGQHAEAALVVTLNVDHAVQLEDDGAFREAYDCARLRLCDGAPLLALARLCGRRLPGRVTGADLLFDVCERAARLDLRVFVAGGSPQVLVAGLAALRARYPGLQISGASPPPGFEGTEHEVALKDSLRAAAPDVVMVCFGAPRSEVWAARQLDEQPAAYLCVGAAIDFAAGAQRRAPLWMQRVGIEWLHRLAREPRRLWRRYLVRDAAFLPLAARELWRHRAPGRAGR